MRVSSEFLHEKLEQWYLPSIDQLLAKVRDPRLKTAVIYSSLCTDAMLAGVCLARLGDKIKAIEYFRLAAEYGRHMHDDEGFDYRIGETLEYSIIARDEPLRRSVARESESILERVQTPITPSYGHALRLLVLGLKKNQVAHHAARVIQQAEEMKPRKIKNYIEIGYILKALDAEKERPFNRHLKNLLAIHQHLATRGQLRDDMGALISVTAVALARLAVERGMRVRAKCDYLPMFLVE